MTNYYQLENMLVAGFKSQDEYERYQELKQDYEAETLDYSFSVREIVSQLEVIISQVPQDSNIRTVKLGVWSTLDGKDDIVWHTARKQSNGPYKVTVDIAQHDDYRGKYQMDLQYVTQDRQKIKVASQKVHVGTNDKKVPEKAPLPIKPAPQHNLPPRGTYRFTQRSDIKAEPKMSSANLSYYNIGDTVNYDRIVQSEGKNWLSYLSFARNHRYIALHLALP